MLHAWTVDLRISVLRTMTGAGAHVLAAANKVLDDGSIDASLAYLNEGLYAARELDCASRPTQTPSATPSATPGRWPGSAVPSCSSAARAT